MAKKVEKTEVWVVVAVDECEGITSYDEAIQEAKDNCELYGNDFRVMKVVESYLVSIPEEPEPEATKENLSNLLGD